MEAEPARYSGLQALVADLTLKLWRHNIHCVVWNMALLDIYGYRDPVTDEPIPDVNVVDLVVADDTYKRAKWHLSYHLRQTAHKPNHSARAHQLDFQQAQCHFACSTRDGRSVQVGLVLESKAMPSLQLLDFHYVSDANSAHSKLTFANDDRMPSSEVAGPGRGRYPTIHPHLTSILVLKPEAFIEAVIGMVGFTNIHRRGHIPKVAFVLKRVAHSLSRIIRLDAIDARFRQLWVDLLERPAVDWVWIESVARTIIRHFYGGRLRGI